MLRLADGFVFGLLLLFGLGCQSPANRDAADSVLRLWKASHGETAQDFEHVLAPFFSQRPALRLEAVVHPWQGWDERYATAYTGGMPPDIAYMPDEFWPRFAAAGKLVALDEMFPEEVEAMSRE
jgi:ABC-type glycerol-3-phosphate transport system substrate-binding protein